MTKIAERTTEQLRALVRETRERYGPRTMRWPDRARAARIELIVRTGEAN